MVRILFKLSTWTFTLHCNLMLMVVNQSFAHKRTFCFLCHLADKCSPQGIGNIGKHWSDLGSHLVRLRFRIIYLTHPQLWLPTVSIVVRSTCQCFPLFSCKIPVFVHLFMHQVRNVGLYWTRQFMAERYLYEIFYRFSVKRFYSFQHIALSMNIFK